MLRPLLALTFALPVAAAAEPLPNTITVRTRIETEVVKQRVLPHPWPGKLVKIESKSVVQPKTEGVIVAPARSAIIICDMWDNHWCKESAKRCDALAKQTAPLIEAARKSGATIIHCPSDTMEFYKQNKARLRAQAASKVEPPANKNLPNPPLPIDDTDGGCDDAKPLKPFKAWKCQNDAITIDEDRDYITDNGAEVYNILKERKIETVFVLGVHTNMCILNRSFGIKQLRNWDVNCLLVRDLTDTMYNPRMKPRVTHDKGTQLVIEFIEQNWCPTVESKQLFKAFQK